MAKKKPKVAICYDFDGTLSPGNMQEYGFFSGLGKAAETFWNESGALAKKNNADPILAYMKLMIDKASIGDMKTTRSAFKDHGKSVKLFDGVIDWFRRINQYGKEKGLCIEHYIVSSGLREMIEGTAIGKEFEKIYACSFMYDANDAAVWPAVAVNYTTKTQFLFRINKGIADDNDNQLVNAFVPDDQRPIPFTRMIYIGDGATDVPCMKLVKDKGGTSIAVYPPKSKSKRAETEKLIKEERVNYISNADYNAGARLDSVIKSVLDKISAEVKLQSFVSKKDEEHKNCETSQHKQVLANAPTANEEVTE